MDGDGAVSEAEIKIGDAVRTKPSAPMEVKQIIGSVAVVSPIGDEESQLLVLLEHLERLPSVPCSLIGFAAETPASWRDKGPLL
jgi:hypothetical protein